MPGTPCSKLFETPATFTSIASPALHGLLISDGKPMPSRILLVDDENSVRDSLYGLLESAGYVSGSCPDAELLADLQAGGNGFLAKPFRGPELLRKARELIESPRQQPQSV
jgi:CheY-like chemotaxis protein